jgi:hypothetical protein
MATYIVDPVHFHAEGAIVRWDIAARRLGVPPDPAKALGTTVELRWMLKADRGLPTEPFLVWARPHSASAGYAPLTIGQQVLIFLGDVTLITWTQGQMSSVRLTITAPSAGAAYAFAGAPYFGDIVAYQTIAAGATVVELSARTITCVAVSPGVTVTAAIGLPPGGYANSPGWTQVEVVGLPVTPAHWAGVGKHGSPQGLIGSFSDAPAAAIARLKRGAPPVGWGPNLAAGVPAPPWSAPDFTKLIGEVNTDLLDYLHDIARDVAPASQAAKTVDVPLPPPENSAGQSTPKPGTTTQLSPLSMTFMAGSTDPFLNLALGFGTAYPYGENIAAALAAVNPAHDFMITAHWEHGLDGASGPLDYAAIVPAPGFALAPPPPAAMDSEVIGALRPLAVDGPWRETVRAMWDRSPVNQLFRIASCAAARASIAPAQPAVALMAPRSSGGYRMLVVNGPLDAPEPPDPEWWRVHVMDREIEIPSNPGTRQMKYGAAVQDIYGQWSTWTAIDRTIAQPALDPVRLANLTLQPVAPASGSVCATTLEFEFLWDWRIRTPQQVSIRGLLFAAANHGDPPPGTPPIPVPAGLSRSLAGGGAALTISFAGDTPSAPGATFVPVSEDGEHQVASFGAAQGTNRRYRVTLPGLSLDFASTPFIGMALWAQGQEHIAPARLTPWPDNPLVTSTGDPRPPVVPIHHVSLGSIPDAAGSSHVQIGWTAQPSAAGYFIYEATEAGLLDAWGLPEPHPHDTLDDRLAVIRNQFQVHPIRRPFTRFNARALTSTGLDIALPKGSTGIHLYVVLGVSAGQVESDWPSVGNSPQDKLIAVAAPHIARPAAPMLEVQQFLDTSTTPATFKARLQVTTRPGPRPISVDIHRVRVDDAARQVDTMGPPIARLIGTTGPWSVTSATDPEFGAYISSVRGVDAPNGSWRRVWYRATSWTKRDETRGGLPGRSEASNAAWVVLPPPDGPEVSPIAIGSGPTPPDVVLQWTSTAPVKRTPLGPHVIAVRAGVAGSDPLIKLDAALDAVATTAPASGSGVWITGTAAGVTTYRALIRRAAVTDVISAAVRITDPIGRTGAQLITVPAGPPDPPPDLGNLQLTKLTVPAPPHLVLRFTSSSSVVPLLDGPYVLTITGVPLVPIVFPPPLKLTEPLGNVPTKAPVPVPPTLLIRSSGHAPFTYTLTTTANLKGFVVRITGPDGKFVEKQV